MQQLENLLADYFGQKLPALPVKVKEVLVVLAPWLTIISVLFCLQSLLSLMWFMGFGSRFAASMMIAGYGYGYG